MNFLGCHLIDVVVSFLGKPDSIFSFNAKSEEGVGEDIAMAILKYGNHYSRIFSSMVEIDGFSRRNILIVGEKMTIEISPTEFFVDGKLYSHNVYKAINAIEGVELGEKKYGPTHRYQEMFKEFAKICRKEIANPYSYEYEILVHDVLLSAFNKTGEEVKL